jgi:hypothetical protein
MREERRFPELGSEEEIVSERNGDKARFNRERKKKILLRKRSRELRTALKNKLRGAGPAQNGILSLHGQLTDSEQKG